MTNEPVLNPLWDLQVVASDAGTAAHAEGGDWTHAVDAAVETFAGLVLANYPKIVRPPRAVQRPDIEGFQTGHHDDGGFCERCDERWPFAVVQMAAYISQLEAVPSAPADIPWGPNHPNYDEMGQ